METHIANLLEGELKASRVDVQDISGSYSSTYLLVATTCTVNETALSLCIDSGGCGSMFKIHVESPEFAGKGLVAQQRMVNAVLKTEIENMHGLTLTTKVTPGS